MRGPWVTAGYYKDPSPEKFHDGWLCTGDVGSVDSRGYVQITDRAKDVIKSGGEWISSVELENLLMAHPDVVEASVVGIPDPRFGLKECELCDNAEWRPGVTCAVPDGSGGNGAVHQRYP